MSASSDDAPITGKQAEEILKELRDIRTLLEKIEKRSPSPVRPPSRPTTATIDVKEPGPILGDVNAPVTVVEFTDYQCPFCKRFLQNTFPVLKRDFIDSGKVRWIVRDLPLAFHPNARKAAQASYCAAEQDKFWIMRDSLFRNNAKLEVENLRTYAKELELDMKAFNSCLDSERHLDTIDDYASIAKGLRLTGTPSFIIGKTTSNKLNGQVVIGAQAPAIFSASINKLLAVEQAPKQ